MIFNFFLGGKGGGGGGGGGGLVSFIITHDRPVNRRVLIIFLFFPEEFDGLITLVRL